MLEYFLIIIVILLLLFIISYFYNNQETPSTFEEPYSAIDDCKDIIQKMRSNDKFIQQYAIPHLRAADLIEVDFNKKQLCFRNMGNSESNNFKLIDFLRSATKLYKSNDSLHDTDYYKLVLYIGYFHYETNEWHNLELHTICNEIQSKHYKVHFYYTVCEFSKKHNLNLKQ